MYNTDITRNWRTSTRHRQDLDDEEGLGTRETARSQLNTYTTVTCRHTHKHTDIDSTICLTTLQWLQREPVEIRWTSQSIQSPIPVAAYLEVRTASVLWVKTPPVPAPLQGVRTTSEPWVVTPHPRPLPAPVQEVHTASEPCVVMRNSLTGREPRYRVRVSDRSPVTLSSTVRSSTPFWTDRRSALYHMLAASHTTLTDGQTDGQTDRRVGRRTGRQAGTLSAKQLFCQRQDDFMEEMSSHSALSDRTRCRDPTKSTILYISFLQRQWILATSLVGCKPVRASLTRPHSSPVSRCWGRGLPEALPHCRPPSPLSLPSPRCTAPLGALAGPACWAGRGSPGQRTHSIHTTRPSKGVASGALM